MAHYETGTHKVEFEDHVIGVSDNKKTPYIRLYFTPKGGTYPRDVTLWLTDKTIDRTVERLRLLGWTGDSMKALAQTRPSPFDGKLGTLVCDASGQYEEWDFPPPGGSTGHAERTPESEEFAAKVGNKLDALFAKELGVGASKAKPDPTPEIDGDDIPF